MRTKWLIVFHVFLVYVAEFVVRIVGGGKVLIETWLWVVDTSLKLVAPFLVSFPLPWRCSGVIVVWNGW
jgi:hypothetical protein